MRLKKVLALLCAAAMVLPSTFMAAETDPSKQSGEGQASVQYDNSVLNYVNRVVLPTIADGMYNFQLDPDMALSDADSDLYDTQTLLFENEDSAAAVFETLTATGTSTFKYGTLAYNAHTTLESELTTASVTIEDLALPAHASLFTDLFVWQPEIDATTNKPNGLGKYVALTAENIETFFTIGTDVSDKINALTAKATAAGDVAATWDGTVYKRVFTEVATPSVATYYQNGEVIDLYIEETITANSEKSYTPATVDNIEGIKTKYKNTSAYLTIKNKSMFDIAVTADVSVKDNGNGLKFAESTSFSAAKEHLWMAINDGTTSTYIKQKTENFVGDTKDTILTDAGVTTRYILAGNGNVSGESLSFMNKAEIDPDTGGYQFYRYDASSAKTNAVTLQITGAANANAEWDDYIEGLRDKKYVRPNLSVVYSFEKVTYGATAVNNASGYLNENGDGYAAAQGGVDGFVAVTNYVESGNHAPSITAPLFRTGTVADLAIPVSLGSGKLAAADLKDVLLVEWNMTANGTYGIAADSNITVTGTGASRTVTIKKDYAQYLEAGTYTMYLIFDEEGTKTQEVTFTIYPAKEVEE